MRIDYLDHILESRPADGVVRIFDFNGLEARKLETAILQFAAGSTDLDISELDFVEPGAPRFVLSIGKSDIGIQKLGSDFLRCSLTKSAFLQMAELVHEYGRDSSPGGHRYLYDVNNPIDLIMSPSGDW